MHMHDGRIASADDAFVVQDGELGLELAHGVHRLLQAREHESWADIVVLDATQVDADIIPRDGQVHLILQFIVDSRDFDFILVRHEQECVAFAEMARLELADSDSAHVFIFF
jgi:hypothetical protein